MPAIDIDRDAAHQAAQHELAKPIYPKEPPLQRLRDLAYELLERLAQQASWIPGGWLTVTVLLIVLAVAVVVAVRIARRAIRTRRRGDYQLFDAAELSAAQHRAAAERCAAEGDWPAAIRHRLRAVARGLEETGVLSSVPGRTANELARDAGARLPGLAAQLSRAALAFNDVTYGERPGTPAAYRLIAELDEHLRASAPGGPLPANQPDTFHTWAQVR